MKRQDRDRTREGKWGAAALALAAFAALAVHGEAARGEPAAPAVPSEAACETLSSDHGKSAASSEKLRRCCDRVFSEAAASARKELDSGAIRFRAAAKGGLVCVDELQKGGQLARRNVITGGATGLRSVTALAFAEVKGRPQLFVGEGDKGQDRVLAFNYRFDGNLPPEREWRKAGLPRSAWMVADGEDLLVLGSDSKIRRVRLELNDLALKEEEKSRAHMEISVDGAGELVALGASSRLGRIFALGSDGNVHVLASNGIGKVAPESSWKAEGVASPVSLVVREDVPAKDVVVEVRGADGSVFSARYSWAPSVDSQGSP